MSNERIQLILNDISQELIKVNQYFTLFWDLYVSPDEYSKAKRVYSSFFYFVIIGNANLFCISIYNLVKSQKNTSSFPKLFNIIKSTKQEKVFFDEICDMEFRINNHIELINKIVTLRDKFIAHIDTKRNGFNIDLNFTYEEAFTLVKELNQIHDRLANVYGTERYMWNNKGLIKVSPEINPHYILKYLTEQYVNNAAKRKRRE